MKKGCEGRTGALVVRKEKARLAYAVLLAGNADARSYEIGEMWLK